MKLLQKILFTVMVCAFAGNVDGMAPVLDLPNETPGLQNGGTPVTHPVTGISCLHVQIPLVGGGNADIYFPTNGAQPTTADAVDYSAATRINKGITEWYMMMFGVIEKTKGKYIAAGYRQSRTAAIADNSSSWTYNGY